ncbi:recombinase RecT [Ochrobactrum intermedium]|uniref:recombinase RecT n=1 Tax=Brucella intermedia TaxID=94625 RepID=UPI00128D4EDE|nr:recombinase RecT [Brucella intermedia]MPR62724.1 recombinase RecT [Brucella intermedia]
MNAVTQTTQTRSPAETFRDQWSKQESEVAVALPPHIPVERFMRVVMTAVSGNPDLMNADRRSLFESAMKAAQDGLLPDGRDGALVIFNAKVKEGNKDVYIKKVQWMPMVGGILKKIRNSGELLSLSAYVVYENDEFQYTLGDEETIVHRPCLDSNRGDAKLVYAIAKTKDGGIYREIMTLKDVEKVRAVSKTGKFGPWADWWDEMAKKTVIRRLAKRLPMSSDLDDLIRRDDELYDFSGRRSDVDAQQNRIQARGSLSQLLRGGSETAQIGQQAQEGFQIEHRPEEPETPASEPDAGEQGASEDDAGQPSGEVEKRELMRLVVQLVALTKECDPNDPETVKAGVMDWAKGFMTTAQIKSQEGIAKARKITSWFGGVAVGFNTQQSALEDACALIGADVAELDEVE